MAVWKQNGRETRHQGLPAVCSSWAAQCECLVLCREPSMNRDIDYAAVAVKTAIQEKFGRASELDDLNVTANETTISVTQAEHLAEGTRDQLLAAVRKADSLERLWEVLADR